MLLLDSKAPHVIWAWCAVEAFQQLPSGELHFSDTAIVIMTTPLAELYISSSDGKKQTIRLDPHQSCLIGRGRLATLRLSDPHVSRTHCHIQALDEHWLLEDVGSSGGTLIAGARIEKYVLQPGDVFTVGRTRIEFRTVAADAESPVPEKRSRESVPIATTLEELIGRQLHHYLVERILDEDADGAVFLAQDTQRQREVALNVRLPKSGEDDRSRRRYLRSVISLRSLQHPNLVRVYSAGQHGPYVWVAMEYVPGANLMQMIERIASNGMLDWQVAYRLAVDIARVLTALEEAGVVHRSITPSCIVRTNEGVFRLAGVSLARSNEGEEIELVTRKSQFVGDQAYLSPEAMQTGVLDLRSDLYGLGACVYGLLTGHPPYCVSSHAELLKAQQAGPPASPKEIQPAIPYLFEGAVMKLLSRDPDKRYQSATNLVRELERIGKYSGISTE